jgi:hypothetical protein
MSENFGPAYCSQACRYVPKDRPRGPAVEKHCIRVLFLNSKTYKKMFSQTKNFENFLTSLLLALFIIFNFDKFNSKGMI